jgi:hypothetical protein
MPRPPVERGIVGSSLRPVDWPDPLKPATSETEMTRVGQGLNVKASHSTSSLHTANDSPTHEEINREPLTSF